MKPIIKIGAGKGKLISVLQQYLEYLGLSRIENKRLLVHMIETEKYILQITFLRWEDIKRYADEFDMIIYGSDQWLESGNKSMISLKYFEQANCRLSLLVPKELENKPFQYFKDRKVATSYENLATEYLGVKKSNIVPISGSVEATVKLGWSDSVFDVVETGETARENGLVEYKTFVKFGAVLATKKVEKIPFFESLGLIEKQEKGAIIAFDGLDGSGKTSLAKYMVQNGKINSKATVLISPYSGHIGKQAKSLWENDKYFEWATIIGKNHWRAPENVNQIYDRSLLTFMTDLIRVNMDKEKILEAIKSWEPLPDILFFCKTDLKEIINRLNKRAENKDEFDEIESLKMYEKLYDEAARFLMQNNIVKVIEIDTSRAVEKVWEDIQKNLLNKRNIKGNIEQIKQFKLEDRVPIVEGKSKKIYKINDEVSLMVFKPHLRSITYKREENIEGTEKLRLLTNLYFLRLLEKENISTQLAYDKIVKIGDAYGLLVKNVNQIPLEFICRYYAAGSLVRQYPTLVTLGQKLKKPLYKFDLKQDIKVAQIDDPTLNENYIVGLDILTEEQFEDAKNKLIKIGEIINRDLASKGIKLIDMKMEFGFDENGEIILIDEISQDCIRANDIETDKSLTKDVFRELKSHEEVLNYYKEFSNRLKVEFEKEVV